MTLQPKISHRLVFIRHFFKNQFQVGAILPSSAALAKGMTAYLSIKEGEIRVLEAGCGTGAFTGEIISDLRPGDSFDAVEINPELFDCLKEKYGHQTGLHPDGVKIRFINDDIRNLPDDQLYDYIVFSLPLTNFSPLLVQEFLDKMIGLLKPGGVFSYVKYIFISRFKYVFGGSGTRKKMDSCQAVIDQFKEKYQIDQRAVLANFPPAWVYYWKKK